MLDTAELEERIGYRFTDRTLLMRALTHRSWVEERHPGGAAPHHESQQRLEFLGDALLNYVVANWVYGKLPLANEHELTRRRTQFTEGEWLRDLGERLGLQAFIRFGNGERANTGNRRVLEDTVEALLGAVAIDGGTERASAMVLGWLPEELPAWDPHDVGDPVVVFNEAFQKQFKMSPPEPQYEVVGPPNQSTWTATLTADGRTAEGVGASKKEAKRAACRAWLRAFADGRGV